MEAPVLQLFKYFFYDMHRFNYHKNKWISQNRDIFEYASAEIKKIRNSADLKTLPLKDVPFTVFDLETTGFFSSMGDEVISIGAIKININHMAFAEHFYEVVEPVKQPSPNVQDLTGLTGGEVKNGKAFPSALLNFLKFARGTVLVAHPASFDVTFMADLISRWSLPDFNPVYIDAQQAAKYLYTDRTYSLDSLVEKFGIDKKNRHHALNDAAMTSEVFKYLIDELIKTGVNTISEYEKVIEREGHKLQGNNYSLPVRK